MKVIRLILGYVLLGQFSLAQSTIQVLLKSPSKELTYLEDIDRFDNNQLTILSGAHQQAQWSVEQPLFLRDADYRSQALYFLTPGKSYTLTRGEGPYLTAKTASDSASALANCHQRYLASQPPLKQGEWGLVKEYLIGDAYRKLTFAQRSLTLRQRYQSRLVFLSQYAQQYHLTTNQLAPWKDFFFYQYVRGVMTHAPGQVPPDSIKPYIRFFGDDTKLYIPEYRAAAASLLRMMGYQPAGKPDFARLYQLARRSFSAGTRDYLLFQIMKTVSQPKQDKSPNPNFDWALAGRLLPSFKADCQQASYVQYITESMDYLTKTRQAGPDKIQLLDRLGQSTTWRQLLAAHRGRIVYVDFWASWCAPCRAELPASHQLRSALSKEKISFLYVSLDEDPKAWSNALQQVGLEQVPSYLLTHSFRSALARQYQLKAIPRYLLFDQQGKLVSANAKRPSDESLQTELQALAR